VQLVSKISNLCDPDPPTLTDGQTDVMQSQYRALHYSASRGNKLKATIETQRNYSYMLVIHNTIERSRL